MSLDITISCLCKKHSFTESISRDMLPLGGHCCHCSSCRHLTGSMYTQAVLWHGPKEEIFESSLQQYAFTERTTVFSCGTCSTTMFAKQGDFIVVATGVLPNLPDVDLVRISDHVYVESSGDGGASSYMKKLNGGEEEVPRWVELRKAPVSSDWPSKEEVKALRPAADKIPFRCHCHGVSLVLENPTITYANVEKDQLPKFVDPETKKLLVSFDVCDSCRLSSGLDIYYWTFSNLSQISFPDGRPVPKTVKELKEATDKGEMGTLSYYASSPDVQRYFCTKCCASVFYAVDELSERVDIGVGLFEGEAARNESFLLWKYGSLGWPDDVKGGWREAASNAIKEESEQWRQEQGLKKTWK